MRFLAVLLLAVAAAASFASAQEGVVTASAVPLGQADSHVPGSVPTMTTEAVRAIMQRVVNVQGYVDAQTKHIQEKITRHALLESKLAMIDGALLGRASGLANRAKLNEMRMQELKKHQLDLMQQQKHLMKAQQELLYLKQHLTVSAESNPEIAAQAKRHNISLEASNLINPITGRPFNIPRAHVWPTLETATEIPHSTERVQGKLEAGFYKAQGTTVNSLTRVASNSGELIFRLYDDKNLRGRVTYPKTRTRDETQNQFSGSWDFKEETITWAEIYNNVVYLYRGRLEHDSNVLTGRYEYAHRGMMRGGTFEYTLQRIKHAVAPGDPNAWIPPVRPTVERAVTGTEMRPGNYSLTGRTVNLMTRKVARMAMVNLTLLPDGELFGYVHYEASRAKKARRSMVSGTWRVDNSITHVEFVEIFFTRGRPIAYRYVGNMKKAGTLAGFYYYGTRGKGGWEARTMSLRPLAITSLASLYNPNGGVGGITNPKLSEALVLPHKSLKPNGKLHPGYYKIEKGSMFSQRTRKTTKAPRIVLELDEDGTLQGISYYKPTRHHNGETVRFAGKWTTGGLSFTESYFNVPYTYRMTLKADKLTGTYAAQTRHGVARGSLKYTLIRMDYDSDAVITQSVGMAGSAMPGAPGQLFGNKAQQPGAGASPAAVTAKCGSAPTKTQCLSLNRGPCMNVNHACGPCLDGYTSNDGTNQEKCTGLLEGVATHVVSNTAVRPVTVAVNSLNHAVANSHATARSAAAVGLVTSAAIV